MGQPIHKIIQHATVAMEIIGAATLIAAFLFFLPNIAWEMNIFFTDLITSILQPHLVNL